MLIAHGPDLFLKDYEKSSTVDAVGRSYSDCPPPKKRKSSSSYKTQKGLIREDNTCARSGAKKLCSPVPVELDRHHFD